VGFLLFLFLWVRLLGQRRLGGNIRSVLVKGNIGYEVPSFHGNRDGAIGLLIAICIENIQLAAIRRRQVIPDRHIYEIVAVCNAQIASE